MADAFERALLEFKRTLPPDEVNKFAGTTLKDLKTSIIAIQNKQKSARTMQNLARIMGFLEAMETYSKVLDIFVNVNDFVAFIWGPIKYLLLVAHNFVEAFNALLDAYRQIAESLPVIDQYGANHRNDPRVQEILELTFIDIFEFHRMALRVFRNSVWRNLFHATWKSFNTKFGGLIDNFKQHKKLLAENAGIAEIQLARRARENAAQVFKDWEVNELMSRKLFIARWLSAVDNTVDQQRGIDARSYHADSGRWLLGKPAFQSWFDLQSTLSPCLWIHGIPGAGKSVLASLIVEESQALAAPKNLKVLYFYCRHGDLERNSFVAMARCFLRDLLNADDQLTAHIYEAAVDSKEPYLRTQNHSRDLLNICLKAVGRTYIILDGLDECEEAEQKHIAEWLRKYVEDSASGQNSSKCVFISQDCHSTRSSLGKLPSIRITSAENRTDIESYCAWWSQRIKAAFHPHEVDEKILATRTSAKADGMFLYAKLVMENLSAQTNGDALDQEMSPGVFPDGIDQAYERILNRLLDQASKGRRHDTIRLFGWIICATRALKWREIQTAFCIDADAGKVNPKRKRRLTAKALGGSLVDEDVYGEVTLVHSTAAEYLQRTRHADDPTRSKPPVVVSCREHLGLALLCLQYFMTGLLSADIDDVDIDRWLKDGWYGFADYACLAWTKHLELGLKPDPPITLPEGFDETLEGFFTEHLAKEAPKQKPKIPKSVMQLVAKLPPSDVTELLQNTMASMRTAVNIGVTDITLYATTDIFEILYKVRVRLEGLAETTPALIYEHYGKYPFKCRRIACKDFYNGFATRKERDTHMDKHERPYLCTIGGCHGAEYGLTTKKDLLSHMAKYHPTKMALDDFDGNGVSETSESEEEEEVEEPKASSFTCQKCDRSFDKKFNLHAHLKTHTDQRKFGCNHCNQAFHRRSDLNRHELIHTGDKSHECTGALRNGVTWGCRSRYARKEALHKHFRSKAGRECLKGLIAEAEAEQPKGAGRKKDTSTRSSSTEPQDAYVTSRAAILAALGTAKKKKKASANRSVRQA